MKKDKDILIMEADRIILDHLSGIKKFLSHKGINTDHLTNSEVANQSLKKHIFNVSDTDVALKLYSEYWESDFVGDLDALSPNVKRILLELSKQYDIWLVMACGESRRIRCLRKQNLQSLFGDVFYGYDHVELSSSKKDILNLLTAMTRNRVVGLIDTCETSLKEAKNLGLNAYRFGVTGSDLNSRFTYIKDWNQIEEIFIFKE